MLFSSTSFASSSIVVFQQCNFAFKHRSSESKPMISFDALRTIFCLAVWESARWNPNWNISCWAETRDARRSNRYRFAIPLFERSAVNCTRNRTAYSQCVHYFGWLHGMRTKRSLDDVNAHRTLFGQEIWSQKLRWHLLLDRLNYFRDQTKLARNDNNNNK